MNLACLLDCSVSQNHAEVIEAQQRLKALEARPGFAVDLLAVLQQENVSLQSRQAGAIYFKNFVKQRWNPRDSKDDFTTDNRQEIKDNLVKLMLGSPSVVEVQLKEAILIIANSDFPSKWPNLLPEIFTVHLLQSDFKILKGALEVAASALQQYQSVERSPQVLSDLKNLVLPHVQQPLLNIFVKCVTSLNDSSLDITSVVGYVNMIMCVCSMFYSIHTIDLPEYFEDNMHSFFEGFLFILRWNHLELLKQSPGMIEELKSVVLQCVCVYADKYQEEFGQYVCVFVEAACTCICDSNTQELSSIVCNGLILLSSIARTSWSHDKNPFILPNSMQLICDQVILPHIKLHDADLYIINEQTTEGSRVDIENAELNPRRKATVELLRVLIKMYFNNINIILIERLNILFIESKNINNIYNKRAWEAAVYLCIAICMKSCGKDRGATELTGIVDINNIFLQEILPKLQKYVQDMNTHTHTHTHTHKHV
eukprot:GHVR01162958.1.p1 GENE.GHVR01162958.1~~GHVR01162958.1.p1  ORF type:complete len:484 (+),score=124.43 GHVR01162958.1:68-1519(+)